MRSIPVLVLLLWPFLLTAQTGILQGMVRNEVGDAIPAVITVVDEGRTVRADEQGRYRLELPAGARKLVRWSFTGLIDQERTVQVGAGETRTIDISLRFFVLDTLAVQGRRRDGGTGLETLDPRTVGFAPMVQGGVEALLSGQLGVMARNELSSGYSVRGGNFDENLVYVNDIEVYRPFLVRAGQQEGLSFPNPDMIERIQFSAGGFEARYGDKMSSVLDIQYKRPKEFRGTAMASLLGGSVQIENSMLRNRLR